VLQGVSGGHLVSNHLVFEERPNLFGRVFTPSVRGENLELVAGLELLPSNEGADVSRCFVLLSHALDEDFAGLVVYPGGKVEVTPVGACGKLYVSVSRVCLAWTQG